jgi:hypothetical protein
VTRRQGRPYTLVLTKADALFAREREARLALAGLSTAAGESHLHVISSGMPRLARRYQWDWTPGLSWCLRGSSGNWHVAMAHEPRTPDNGMQAYTLDDGIQVFWLRLTPPLATISDVAEIVVTGPATRARATVTVHPAGS